MFFLKAGTTVGVAIADGHASVAGTLKEAREGQMVMIMGTSCAHFLLGTEDKIVPGCFSVAIDSVLPGFYGYECGQSGFGDHYAWFVDHCMPANYLSIAQAKGMNAHQNLTELATELVHGESGLHLRTLQMKCKDKGVLSSHHSIWLEGIMET